MKKKKKESTKVDRAIKGAIKTIAVGTIMNVSGQLTKPVIDKFCMLLRDRALFSVSIYLDSHRMKWGISHYFKHLPQKVDVSPEYEASFVPMMNQFNSDGFDLTWYKGVPIALLLTKENQGRPGPVDQNARKLYTLNNPHCISVMKEFIEELMEINNRHEYAGPPVINVVDSGNSTYEVFVQDRTFDNIFMPEVDRNRIKEMLDAYVSNREFYENAKLPNHFGVLLHGASGGGKSSLAIAISHYLNASMTCMTGDQLSDLPDVISHIIWSRPSSPYKYRILLIEDIDSWIFSKDRQKKYRGMVTNSHEDDDNKNKKDVGLATILNCIDGIGAPTNIIYIFTTNHMEMLDPALVRPGRMDLVIEMKPVCEETLIQFLKFHYPNENIPTITSIRDGIKFAELQTLVMQGKSIDDVVAHCRKDADASGTGHIMD